MKDTERDLAFPCQEPLAAASQASCGESLSLVENSLDPVSGFDYRVARFHYRMPFDLTSRVGVATGGFGTNAARWLVVGWLCKVAVE